MLKRYRQEIRYDLQLIGVDLSAEVRARRFVKILDLLDQMPGTAHWRAAHANDPLAVEALLSQDIEIPDAKPSLTEWSPEVGVLTQIMDLLISFMSGKSHQSPTPESLLSKAIETIRHNQMIDNYKNDLEVAMSRFQAKPKESIDEQQG